MGEARHFSLVHRWIVASTSIEAKDELTNPCVHVVRVM